MELSIGAVSVGGWSCVVVKDAGAELIKHLFFVSSLESLGVCEFLVDKSEESCRLSFTEISTDASLMLTARCVEESLQPKELDEITGDILGLARDPMSLVDVCVSSCGVCGTLCLALSVTRLLASGLSAKPPTERSLTYGATCGRAPLASVRQWLADGATAVTNPVDR